MAGECLALPEEKTSLEAKHFLFSFMVERLLPLQLTISLITKKVENNPGGDIFSVE